jgi:hypothetical protein
LKGGELGTEVVDGLGRGDVRVLHRESGIDTGRRRWIWLTILFSVHLFSFSQSTTCTTTNQNHQPKHTSHIERLVSKSSL